MSDTEFITVDINYFSELESARSERPLGDGARELGDCVRNGQTPPVSLAVDVMLDAETILSDSSSPQHTRMATRRDIEPLFGFYRAARLGVPHEIEGISQSIIEATGASPRANFYEYTMGNSSSEPVLYTNDQEEYNLVQSFRRGIQVAHVAVHSLLEIEGEALGEDQEIENSAVVLESVEAYRKEMASVNSSVGPEYVAKQLQNYVGSLPINNIKFDGPNPSHSGYMLLDTLLIGSAMDDSVRRHTIYRMTDMPQHIRREVQLRLRDEPVLGRSIQMSDDTVENLRAAKAKLRKAKLAHKGYADRGLEAKGGSLGPGSVDLLSPLIEKASVE